MNNAKITISKGNAKLGAIPSVSLPSCTTCNPSAPCFKDCYARKIERLRKNVRESYEKNLAILTADPSAYWLQVKASAMVSRFFRYNVSGDIPNREYFAEMVRLAEDLPSTHFLAFTKQYGIINDYITNGGKIPPNLQIILSNWGDWKCPNPHNLPTCEVIFKGDTVGESWHICGGNCTACAVGGFGCWTAKKGDTIAIYKH
jgi:hypothetical protein